MKNFLDLLDINTSELLNVSVEITEHGYVKYLARLNDTSIETLQYHTTLDLFAPITLNVNLLEFNEGSSGVEVKLYINGLEVLPLYQHLASTSNNYIDKTGKWEFTIPTSFYNWYHTVSGQGWLLTPDK
jgi:hypothetical protein